VIDDVLLEAFVAPCREGIDLGDVTGRVELHDRRVGASGSVDPTDSGDPTTAPRQSARERFDLAPRAATLHVELPLIVGHHVGGGLEHFERELQTAMQVVDQPLGFGEQILRVEHDDRRAGCVRGHQMHEHRILETGGQDQAGSEGSARPGHDASGVIVGDVGR
jgi:hypothetical protein